MAEGVVRGLIAVFGYPHELLHLLALLLIGRRAKAVRQRYIDIPDDLTTGQFVFVAGLPALVFWGAACAGGLLALDARSPAQVIGGLALAFVMSIGGAGTLGDLHLIMLRLTEAPPDDDAGA